MFIFIFSAVYDLKTRLLSALWCHSNRFLCCIITREWWFRVDFIHVEIPAISLVYSFRFPSGLSFFMRYCTIPLLTNVIYNSAERSYLLINGALKMGGEQKESSWSKFVQVSIWLPMGHWILGLLGMSLGRWRSPMGSWTLWWYSWFISPSFDLHSPVGELRCLHQPAKWIRNPRKLLNSLLQSHVVAGYLSRSLPYEKVW